MGIISESRLQPSAERTARLLGLGAVVFGAVAVLVYEAAGLTLSHYDAKAHLVVARRVIDSLTPGWRQIGAVWLPLPHLINLLPVQVDWLYRTGASAVAVSVASFGVMTYACARLILHATGSRAAAVVGCLVVLLNPDLLYLQATPMTEALLLALTTLGIARLARWLDAPTPANRRVAGLVLSAACLTRYEAWPITAAALAIAALALWRREGRLRPALVLVAGVAVYPVVAGLAFFVHSRLTVGHWFVTGGFYVPDNADTGRPLKTVGSIWWASHRLNGYVVLVAGTFGAVLVGLTGLLRRRRASLLVCIALAASAALPWYAFFIGHPFRFRYMVPLVPALGVYVGCAVGLLPQRVRMAAAAVLGVLILVQARPFDARAPMVVEAQLDRAHSIQRREVTAYLAAHRPGGKILVSFASLSHYVQELSSEGFAVRDFVHEGNGDLWVAASTRPRTHVRFIAIEEFAEGGDRLARQARQDPGFLEGFRRVAEGGGVALYERTEP